MNGPGVVGRLLSQFQRNVLALPIQGDRRGFGLALSGGIDSTALAWLWHASQNGEGDRSLESSPWRLPFKAIIIDHQLRAESARDAEKTRERFHRLTGQEALIVTLDWTESRLASGSRGVETSARRLRYRALGKACRDHDLNVLLTGHHADDNAETILLRLLKGTRSGNVRGISTYTNIPECEGLDEVSQKLSTKSVELASAQVTERLAMVPAIHVARPLLTCTKDELRQLCQEVGAEWAEDKTNSDATFTLRNAIRNLFSDPDRLPKALTRVSLCQIADMQTLRTTEKSKQVQRLHCATCKAFDDRSGVLTVQLPPLAENDALGDPYVRHKFFQDLISAISARSDVTLADCSNFADKVCEIDLSQKACIRSALAEGGLIGSKLSTTSFDISAAGVTATMDPIADQTGQPTTTWRLAALSPPRSQASSLTTPLKRSADNDAFLTNADFPDKSLWDGRWWIKIIIDVKKIATADARGSGRSTQASSSSSEPYGVGKTPQYVIRPANANDIAELRRLAKSKTAPDTRAQSAARAALQVYQGMQRPRNRMSSLPVVAEQNGSENYVRNPGDGDGGRCIAFPSIGYVHPHYSDAVLEVALYHKWLGDAADQGRLRLQA